MVNSNPAGIWRCIYITAHNTQLIHTILGDSQNYQSRGVVDKVIHSTESLIVLTRPERYDIIQLHHTFLGDSQNHQLLGVLDHLMNHHPWPKLEGDSSSNDPQHRERYDIDVLLRSSYFGGIVFFWSLWSFNTGNYLITWAENNLKHEPER